MTNLPPQAPKQGETDGKLVKKQLVTKLINKILDKPDKTVYNIRKDAREVQAIWSKYLCTDDRRTVEFNYPHGQHDYIRNWILLRSNFVWDICNEHNLPLPILAGGALRDLFWNKLPKDADFFWQFSNEDEAYEFMDRLTLVLRDHGGYAEGGGEGYEQNEADFEGVYGVFNFGAACQGIVRVVDQELNAPIYDTFDLSVCQAQMDITTKEIQVSEEFLTSIVKRKVINYRPQSRYSCIREMNNSLRLSLKNNNNKETNYLKQIQWLTVPADPV